MGWTARDLGEGLEAPKRARILPRTLGEEETMRLVASVDGTTPRDLRDRAMLETLYGCGLRVSELCALELTDLVIVTLLCFFRSSLDKVQLTLV